MFLFLVSSLLLLQILRAGAFSGAPQSSKNPVKVLVTGAAGKTGRIVLSKLEQDHRYEPMGLFRTERSARKIVKNDDTLCPLEHVVVADVTSSTFLKDLSEGTGLENIEAMIICTSAVPRIRKRSLAAMLVKAPWRALRGEPAVDINSMRFAWKHGGYPEKVDYRGQIAQIDLAKKLGIPHVVLVGSMGGTDPENFLNTVGKTTTKSNDKEGNGDILLWKRRAEKYLVASGLDYTILHPGHLVDIPGGQEEFVLGVDDELYGFSHPKNSTSKENRAGGTRIGREDVAELCVAALSVGKGKQISFDCITVSPSAISSALPPSSIENETPVDGRAGRNTPRSRADIHSSFFATGGGAATSAATSPASTATATKDSVPGASSTGRLPVEDVLHDFLDLSRTTNYDLDP